MILKEAKLEDFERLYPLFNFWLMSIGSVATKEETSKEFTRIVTSGVMFYLLENENIAGIISGEAHYNFWNNETVAGEFLWFVMPEHRKSGVGKLLVSAFEGWAKARGCNVVAMGVNKHASNNPERARDALLGYNYQLFGYQLRKVLGE